MKRAILAFAAGLVLWILVISVLNRGLRVLMPGYALAEPTMSFTLGMQVLLLIAFVPVHVQLWSLFPFWYHLVFLGTLVPLMLLGSRLSRLRAVAVAPAGGTHA